MLSETKFNQLYMPTATEVLFDLVSLSKMRGEWLSQTTEVWTCNPSLGAGQYSVGFGKHGKYSLTYNFLKGKHPRRGMAFARKV